MSQFDVTRHQLPVDDTCGRDGIDEAYVYERKLLESLYVYCDAAGRVACTERAMTFSTVTH